MPHFTGMKRYSRLTAWLVVGAYLGAIVASIWYGIYLLALPVSASSGVLMMMISIFIATRLRGIQNIIHECCHSTFSEHWKDNGRIGRLCASLLMKSFRKYRDDHMSHQEISRGRSVDAADDASASCDPTDRTASSDILGDQPVRRRQSFICRVEDRSSRADRRVLRIRAAGYAHLRYHSAILHLSDAELLDRLP
jgi:hypothetical protein